jgi:hypothetical protein
VRHSKAELWNKCRLGVAVIVKKCRETTVDKNPICLCFDFLPGAIEKERMIPRYFGRGSLNVYTYIRTCINNTCVYIYIHINTKDLFQILMIPNFIRRIRGEV